MKKLKDNIKHIWIVVVYAIIAAIYGVINRPWNKVYDMTTIFDIKMPFIKAFIVPYYSWYAFLGVGILFLLIKDKRNYYKALFSLCIGVTVCYIIFLLFQTTLTRPEVVGQDILSEMVRNMYRIDNPFNCFPSIHVYTTFVLGYFILKIENINYYQKTIVITSGVSIILSTVFVKQHLILDVIAALVLGCLMIKSINFLEEKMLTSKNEGRESTYSQ